MLAALVALIPASWPSHDRCSARVSKTRAMAFAWTCVLGIAVALSVMTAVRVTRINRHERTPHRHQRARCGEPRMGRQSATAL